MKFLVEFEVNPDGFSERVQRPHERRGICRSMTGCMSRSSCSSPIPTIRHPRRPSLQQPGANHDSRIIFPSHVDAGLPPAGHARPTIVLGETPQGHRRIGASTGGTFRGPELRGTLLPAQATGRPSCPTAPHSATSATRCRPTPATCSTSSHAACATARLRSSRVSSAKTSTPANTPSAPQPRSSPPPCSSSWPNKGVVLHQRRRPPGQRHDLRDLPR